MRAKRVTTHDGAHYGIRFLCPGCKDDHVVTTKPYAGGWEWNGSIDRPTISLSILVHEVKRVDGTTFSPRCHSFVNDGRIQFLGDSQHALSGQTVDLPDLPECE